MRRNYSRRTARRSGLGTVIQSYKKVLNVAPASVAAATQTNTPMTSGVDSVAAGQTSVTDPQVPTGAVVKFIEIQLSVQNLVNIAAFGHVAIQLLRSGQAQIAANAVGGNPQRNQVFHLDMFSLGTNQNVNRKYRFKIPRSFQRIREGDSWQFSFTADQIRTEAYQIIYKFYR